MSSRSSASVDYNITCEVDECRWEYKRNGTSKWEPFQAQEHKIIETAHILKEDRAQVQFGGGFGSRVIVDLRNRTFTRAYGGTYDIRRLVLYSRAEILKRRNRELVLKFARNKSAKKFADKLFDKFKDEPESDSDDEDDDEPEEEVIEENLIEFCQEIGVDHTTIQPALLFWVMNVKGYMEVTREELYLFLQKSGSRDLASLRAATARLSDLVSGDKNFTDFYMWNFVYYRNAQEQGKKFIPIATARQVQF